ncbi:MAG: gamma-glutamyltransferase family protein [Saprospiraceae bacterium]|nr:gamma-glutamyltransferase family protein [Saprospiraceae bacterium]
MDSRIYPDNPIAIGTRGAVTNTFHAAASRAGIEALKQGGTSVDAALTTALTQITLNAGSVVSFFGILNMVHYDASRGELVSMDASWNAVKAETDPMSIPGIDNIGEGLFAEREVSGRSALVGGFMRGVDAAHARFGKLPYKALFDPSLYLAENGFVLNDRTADYFKRRDKQLRRLKETRETLIKEDGSSYQAGDLFKQPALARTLRALSVQGSSYMYNGPWAEKAIAAIQADGGKMRLTDLAEYEVIWNEPVRAEYGDYEIAVMGYPSIGSVNLIEALNLAYISGLTDEPHWTEDGNSLRKICDITNTSTLSYLPEITRRMLYQGMDLSNESRLTKETAEQLWAKIIEGVQVIKYSDQSSKHSDTVVAIDKWGNMTAITHSINAAVWGNEAIVVDGVSISDAASIQKIMVQQAGPGNRVPSPIEVGIILKKGKPYIPFASMSTGLHQQTVQSILNIIAYDMDIEEAVNAPSIFLPLIEASHPLIPKQSVRVMKGDFPPSVLESSKLPVIEILPQERRYAQGLWIGIEYDQKTKKMKAVSAPYANGKALAF